MKLLEKMQDTRTLYPVSDLRKDAGYKDPVSCIRSKKRYIKELFTLDMELIPKWAKLNFAVLPIGDNFTMSAEDAAECAKMIDCKTIVGVHFDTFGFIKIDHEKAKKTFSDMGAELHLLKIGDSISF